MCVCGKRKVREADLSWDVFSARHGADNSVKQRRGGKNVSTFLANTNVCKSTNTNTSANTMQIQKLFCKTRGHKNHYYRIVLTRAIPSWDKKVMWNHWKVEMMLPPHFCRWKIVKTFLSNFPICFIENSKWWNWCSCERLPVEGAYLRYINKIKSCVTALQDDWFSLIAQIFLACPLAQIYLFR